MAFVKLPGQLAKASALALAASLLVLPTTTTSMAESMTSAVKRAVKTHPSVKSKRANQRAVANELEESRSSFLPQVSLFGDAGIERVENDSSLSVRDSGRTNFTREAGVSVQYTLFDGYERANILYRNAARLDGAIWGLLATSEATALNAVEAYIDVVRHRELLAAAHRNIKRHKRILRLIRARVSGGKSPASDAFQIEERVFAAQAVEVEITKALKDANAKYRKAVGRSPGKKMRVARVKHLPKSRSQLEQTAIANSYEIKALEKVANENQYAGDASASGLSPKVSLEGRASIGADRNGSRGTQNDAYVGLRLQWKLFDGGATDSRAGAFAERAQEALYERDVRVRDIREIAEKSWAAYHEGRKRNAILLKQLKQNKKIVTNYREEYELSKRSLLDVLDAERARFNNEFQQISVSAGYRFSAFRMLAIQSRLMRFFGLHRDAVAPRANNEQRFRSTNGRAISTGSSQSVFDINIEPLK
ncbi:TolC family protein [Pseudahrensia aquimaris]|uniref:TolC family protein n=1 Tax=Pseudahrensia aquimaris TaxID=744461 RepID=A0ABW3FB75_9HYPH